MTDTVRCPACRGAKKVAKLGGVIGECNTCKGEGKINACDKPVMFTPVIADSVSEIQAAVVNAVPISISISDPWNTSAVGTTVIVSNPELPISDKVVIDSVAINGVNQELKPMPKLDPKKAIFKRKKV